MNDPAPGAHPRSTRVGIVMLTWNAIAYTKRCLSSLLGATTYPDYEVVVVDNGSTDGSVEWLRTVDGIRLLENGRNLGFTGGVNAGLAALAGDCDAILVNNDLVFADPEWIGRLRDCAYSAPDVGIVGCRLVDGDGRLLHAGSYVTPVAMKGEQIGGELDVGQYVDRREVECAVGAVLYLKRSLLDVTGGLHREYFSYFEDTDVCFEAARAGYRTLYEGGVTLVHHQNVSTRENRTDLWEMYERSHGIFVRRWERWIRERYRPIVRLRAPIRRAGSEADADAALDLAVALHEERVGVALRDVDGCPAPLGHPLLDDMAARESASGDVEVLWGDPRELVPSHGTGRRVLVAATAPARMDQGWARAANRCSEIWAASAHARDELRRFGVEVPVEVLGWGIDPGYFHPGARRFRSRGCVLVGSLVDWTERHDPASLLLAFNAAFSRHDACVLHCHVRWAPPAFDSEAALAAVDLDPGGGRVVLTHAAVARPERCAMYRSWDVCLVADRDPWSGDGVLAPMAVGVPTCAFAAGAAAELLDPAGSWPVANLDAADLVDTARGIVQDPAACAARAGAGSRIAASHTWARVATRVRHLLGSPVSGGSGGDSSTGAANPPVSGGSGAPVGR